MHVTTFRHILTSSPLHWHTIPTSTKSVYMHEQTTDVLSNYYWWRCTDLLPPPWWRSWCSGSCSSCPAASSVGQPPDSGLTSASHHWRASGPLWSDSTTYRYTNSVHVRGPNRQDKIYSNICPQKYIHLNATVLTIWTDITYIYCKMYHEHVFSVIK